MSNPPPPPSLLTLPPDLRLRIYTHLLVSPTPLKGPSARLHSRAPTTTTTTIHTAILRVNKQLNAEARHIFFGMNTFSINSVPLAQGNACLDDDEDDEEEEDGSGAFEPPLQLKDLALVSSLDVDLVYWSRNPRAAERYVTSLSFLLHGAKESLTRLRIGGDGRRYLSSSCSSVPDADMHVQGKGTLDVKKFLAGFRAASESGRFQDALAALNVASVGVRFEFEEMWFDFTVERNVLVKNDLAHLAGQVLVARTEIGIRETLEELERVEGEEMEEVEC